MSVAPLDFLEEARNLHDDKAPEIRLRTVISRAYYAAHHASRSWSARQGGVFDKDRGVHGQVIRYLMTNPDKEIRQLGNRLNKLRRIRNSADYEIAANTVSHHDAREAVASAKGLLTALFP